MATDLPLIQYWIHFPQFSGLHTQKAYTHTGTSSKILLLSALRQKGEYAWAGGKEFGVRIGWRKYVYECTLSGM